MPFARRPDARIWWDQSGTGDPILLVMGTLTGLVCGRSRVYHRRHPRRQPGGPALPPQHSRSSRRSQHRAAAG